MKFVRLRVTRQINFDFNLTLKNNCICSVKRRKRRKTKTRKKSHAQMCSMINFVYRKIKVVKEIINNSVWNIENHCVWVSFSLYSFYLDRVDAKTCQEILWCFCRLCVYVVNIQIALKTGKNRREKKKKPKWIAANHCQMAFFKKAKKKQNFFSCYGFFIDAFTKEKNNRIDSSSSSSSTNLEKLRNIFLWLFWILFSLLL